MSIDRLDQEMKHARSCGALFHPTNPVDAWHCVQCGVFGRGEKFCWSCDSKEHMKFQWVPRFGGGSQNVGPEVPILL